MGKHTNEVGLDHDLIMPQRRSLPKNNNCRGAVQHITLASHSACNHP